MGSFVVATEFTYVDLHASIRDLPPGPIQLFKSGRIPHSTVPRKIKILRFRRATVAGPPSRALMAHRHGLIAPPGMNHAKVGEFRHGEVSRSEAVYEERRGERPQTFSCTKSDIYETGFFYCVISTMGISLLHLNQGSTGVRIEKIIN